MEATATRAVESPSEESPSPLHRLALDLERTTEHEPEPQRADAIAAAMWQASRLGTEEAAQLLASAAEKSSLSRWKTSEDDDLRSIAVEALVEMGHPYALFVPPEALIEVRGTGPRSRRWRRLARLTTLGAGLSSGVSAAAMFSYYRNDVGAPLVLLAVVAALAGFGDYRAEKKPGSLSALLTFFVLAFVQAAMVAALVGPGAIASGVSSGLFLLTLLLHAIDPGKRP